MPLGLCDQPVCWNVTFNFLGANLLLMQPPDVPDWTKGKKRPLANFQQMANALMAKLNADAIHVCDKNCVCVRLNKKAINVRYEPQYVGPHPDGVRDIYMENIFANGIWGICLPKKGPIRIQKDGEWVYPEDLPATDKLPNEKPPSSGGSGGHKKKKGKKGKTRRGAKRPSRR